MDQLSQVPQLSTADETKGFDHEAGSRWIYPENLPVREYQYSIVNTALFHNTLVCLPTGLGKTFIAAVVMYNYFRWYPRGIIVFLAPTKPLVAQQIDACHDIMGIPISVTIELTGATNQKKRYTAWRQHRVIFATPQTFQKDLEHDIVPTELVKCIVIDEAHKALGKHSYSESIRMMHTTNPYFRILALSATPGAKLEAVQEVIKNLHITHLELRDDTSPDITPYINERKLDIILVDLGQDLSQFKERYIEIMDRHVRILLQYNVLRTSTAQISKGRIFHILNEFKSRPIKPVYHGIVMKTLNILLTMYHAYELIIRHGLRAFVHFYQNHSDKFWLDKETELQELLENVKTYLGSFPDVKPFMDGTITEVPTNLVFGHGKFETLRNILVQHFRRAENKTSSTRAIVFTEYRDIVNELYILLLQSRPLIRPQIFVGQAGLKQKQQKKALEEFRDNNVNVLISTSVGEEGLDVGEVDLIICFDISQHSPTRLVQRMGRTGRKRNGHIIILVTDGKEYETLQAALAKRDSLNTKVMHSSGVITALQNSSPRMIPENITPEVQKIHMTVLPKGPPEKKGRKKKNPLETEKKSTKKANTKNKKVVENSGKNTGQGGSLMRFFTTAVNDYEIDNDIVAPKIQDTKVSQNNSSQPLRANSISLGVIKQSDVKLLTNDNETIEFLTLCATKQSEKENNNDVNDNDRNLAISYVPQTFNCDNFLSSWRIPDDETLDYLKSLKVFVKPVEIAMTQLTLGVIPGGPVIDRSPENLMEISGGNNFEDLLDTSDSELEAGCGKESPPETCVDWNRRVDEPMEKDLQVNVIIKSNFEDVLMDSSDEEVQRSPELINEKSKLTIKNSCRPQAKGAPAECVRGSAFENILDEPSDEDLDETQFNSNDVIDPKNDDVPVQGNSNERDVRGEPPEETGKPLIMTDISRSPRSLALVDFDNDEISPYFYESVSERSPVNAVHSSNKATGTSEIGKIPSEPEIPVENYNIEENKLQGKINVSGSKELTPTENRIANFGKNKNQLIVSGNLQEIDPFAPNRSIGITSNVVDLSKSENDLTANSQLPTNLPFSKVENRVIKSDDITFSDLDDEFASWEDMKAVETMPQVSLLPESVIPQASTCRAYQTNQKLLATPHAPSLLAKKSLPHVLGASTENEVNEVSTKQRERATNGNSLFEKCQNFRDNQKDSYTVGTPKKSLQLNAFNRLLNHSKTSSGQNKSVIDSSALPGSSLTSAKKPNKMLDDFNDSDWDSDFETPSDTVLTESRFFKDNAQPPAKLSESAGSSGEFVPTKHPMKTHNKPSTQLKENSRISDNKLRTIRETLFSKPSKQFISQRNSDSDDDFSTTKIQKEVISNYQSKLNYKSIKNHERANKEDDQIAPGMSSHFAVPKRLPQKMSKETRNEPTGPRERRKKVGRKRDRGRNDFINDEAEESDDCCVVTDTSDEDDGEDLADFVSYTQVHDDSVDMKAYYLQSTKSPKNRTGFHLRKPRTPPPNVAIFSQAVEPDTYLYDSFCVSASQEDEVSDVDSSPGEITIIEEIDRKTSNKRKRGSSPEPRGRRKRIQTVEDNSSDDETENMRAAILEQSMLLKQQR